MVVEICKKPMITLGLVYKPPNLSADLESTLLNYIEKLAVIDKLLIIGDFNYPDVDWQAMSACSPPSIHFCDILFEHNLTQLVLSPTHIKGNTLDLVITNSEDIINDVRVEASNTYSDHFEVHITLALSQPNESTNKSYFYTFDYSKADFAAMSSFMLAHDFSDSLQTQNIDELWFYIKSIILEGVNKFVPRVRIRSKNMPKWFTAEIKHRIDKLRYRRRKHFKKPTSHSMSIISEIERVLQEDIMEARSGWECQLVKDFAGHKNYQIFNHIRSLSRHATLPNPMSLNSEVVSTPQEKAEVFNKYFHSVLSKSSSDLPVLDSYCSHPDTLNSINIEVSEVYNAMASLDPTKAMGIDNISPKILKYCALALCEPITHLFKLSLDQSHLPAEWKLHMITPIYKSGDKSLISNYRPISLLCIISKVLEKIVYNHIIDYLSSNVIINPSQFGFRKGKSTIQQLLIFLESIVSGTCRGGQVDTIYLDFRKAFDSVPHCELLHKLRSSGISGKLWEWFREYLSDRFQSTSIANCRSSFLPVPSGVPQGSILGPILFILYLNDLPLSVHCSKLLSFADDTKCFKQIRKPEDSDLFQEDLHHIGNWSSIWKMAFNISKFALVQFTTSKETIDSTYSMNGTAITSCRSHKDLGIILSSDLSWSDHYKHILAKAYGKLGMIRRTFSKQSATLMKKSLYTSLIRSQLLYGSQLWRPMLLKDIVKLEQMQRRSTKYILQDYTSDYKTRLLSLNILPLMMLYELNDIMFFIKNVKEPSDSFDILKYVTFNSSTTRSSKHKLAHSRSCCNSQRHFYFTRLIRLWNTLPIIDLNLSLDTLRHHIKSYMWSVFCSQFQSLNPCSFHLVCPCSRCMYTPRSPNFNNLVTSYS